MKTHVLRGLASAVLVAGGVLGGIVPAAAQSPYSLPWQLRPAGPGRVFRVDSAIASYEGADGAGGTTSATMLLAGFKVRPNLGLFGRLGLVTNDPPAGESAATLVNPAAGAALALKPGGHWRGAVYLACAFPVGMGGGNAPDAAEAAATRSGILARSAMDNAMFAVNDLVIFPGIDMAWVKDGWTLQAEATVLELIRLRGKDVQKDSAKTNFTSGIHAGYFVHPNVSLSGDLRYQRWLSTPAGVKAAPKTRDTATFAAGPRFHFKLSDTVWFRPGIAYALGLDAPMSDMDYGIVQIDLPVSY